MRYKNIISDLWLVNSEDYRTKLNDEINEIFPNSSDIHNTLNRSLPFVEFNINSVLVNVYKSPAFVSKDAEKDAEKPEDKDKLQILGDVGLKNGETRKFCFSFGGHWIHRWSRNPHCI